jgi:hypothetical protein
MKECYFVAASGKSSRSCRIPPANDSPRPPATLASKVVRPVILPPGLARLAMKPEPIGSARLTKTIGIVLVSFCSSAVTVSVGQDYLRLQCDELFRQSLCISRLRGRNDSQCEYCDFPTTYALPGPDGAQSDAPSCSSRPRAGPRARQCGAFNPPVAHAQRVAKQPSPQAVR